MGKELSPDGQVTMRQVASSHFPIKQKSKPSWYREGDTIEAHIALRHTAVRICVYLCWILEPLEDWEWQVPAPVWLPVTLRTLSTGTHRSDNP